MAYLNIYICTHPRVVLVTSNRNYLTLNSKFERKHLIFSNNNNDRERQTDGM